MIKKLVVLATTALLTGCVTTSDTFNQNNQIGTVYTGAISVPQGEILLPPGEWTVVGKSISKNNSSQPFGNVVLAKIDDENNLDGLVSYSTALETTMNYFFYASGYCDPDSDTLYFDQSANQEGGMQQCFFIEDWSLNISSNAASEYVQADNYFKTYGIKKPSTMLFSSHRVSRRNKLLIAQYGFNYRQPTDEMLPGYTPATPVTYDKQFGTDLWKTNLETVIAWSKEKEDLVAKTFLD